MHLTLIYWCDLMKVEEYLKESLKMGKFTSPFWIRGSEPQKPGHGFKSC